MATTKNYLKLNDIDCYKKAFHLSNYIWDLVFEKWGNFERRTVGEQIVRAMDSISANIAEGFGRHYKKDKIRFYRIARGSLKECFDWTEKAKVRMLISEEDYKFIFSELNALPMQINILIKNTNANLKE